jgi:hypothetical protein
MHAEVVSHDGDVDPLLIDVNLVDIRNRKAMSSTT